MSMFDGPCKHGRASEFDCDECSYDPSKVNPDPQKCVPIFADHIIAERDALQARVAELEAVLREASDALSTCRTCSGVEEPGDMLCVEKHSDRRSWCGVCEARAALDAVAPADRARSRPGSGSAVGVAHDFDHMFDSTPRGGV